MTSEHDRIADRLVELGFSQYEARTYVGLLRTRAATGYTVANVTGVPQPKVYETLRRLVERRAAVRTAERPARYEAVAPATLLADLEDGFRRRVEEARRGLAKLPGSFAVERPLAAYGVSSFPLAAERATEAIRSAKRRVYLSGRAEELAPLASSVAAASARGVEFVIVHFGRLPFPAPHGQVLRHASTDSAVHSSRRARHLGVVVDSQWSLWILARDGKSWEGICGTVPLIASLIKTYVRHDLFVQRIYADAPAELEARYGPGLMRLAEIPDDGEAEATGTKHA
ncbi:MAG: TrmB family transcriptional regulator [Chloroflexota bacterium]|nr:TrmB family transcriptional regulator [Chloroflexota bacterium]